MILIVFKFILQTIESFLLPLGIIVELSYSLELHTLRIDLFLDNATPVIKITNLLRLN